MEEDVTQKRARKAAAAMRYYYKHLEKRRAAIKAQKRKWRKDNPEASKAINRRSYYKNRGNWKTTSKCCKAKCPQRKKADQKKWQSKNLNKCATHAAVWRAIALGELTKPTHCTACGGGGEIEAHHHNGYDLEHRFDVQWLCTRCHGVATRADNARTRSA